MWGNYRLREGDPAGRILRLAQDVSADPIAMGTYGTTGSHRLLVGGVAESVLRQAPCPVLTVCAIPAFADTLRTRCLSSRMTDSVPSGKT